ncbi:MAG: calcium-translocating P-type ATPase, PMCA-type [Deltaproteobacteria bacterium]|nr:calcium-translocating P-type ATPase, PMCA-type [Deltaproteobacteria bacterium]MDZ4347227.1 calcium-translocating P-type ATPase, PMCA-type [Candidatus Binatia bacterium]
MSKEARGHLRGQVPQSPWHSMEMASLLGELDTDPQRGLAAEEAKRRLEKYGYNELAAEEKTSPYTLFINQFKNTLIIILLVATVLSALVGELVDAGIIVVIVLFCAVLGFIQEYRAERALDALKKMLTPSITVLRGGKENEVLAKELVPGDILLLEAGDKIPTDGRLSEIHSLQCDEAPLTGESFPVEKALSALPVDVPVGDRKNMVFTGTSVTYGRGKAVVTATGVNTEFGKIAAELVSVSQEKTPLEKRTEEIGKWLGIIASVICVLVVGASIVRESMVGKLDIQFTLTMLMFAIALAVAAVPEALAAIVTGVLAIGMHEMAKQNALIRRMPAVETLGCTTVICSDKTGTLTKGEMTVRRVFSGGNVTEVSGVGYAPQGEFNSSLNDPSLNTLLKGGVLCNDSTLAEDGGKWSVRGDPTEGALVVLAAKAGVDHEETKQQNARINEFPFSSDRKRMTTIHRMEDGKIRAFVKGAPEVILDRCSSLLNGNETMTLGSTQREGILKANEEMANDALRVLAIAYKDLPEADGHGEDLVEEKLVFVGLVGMMDPPRAEAIDAVKVCREVQIRPIMITGDHKLTAVAIAKEIGIYREGDLVLTGDELNKMEDKEFEAIVDKITVYARVSPLDKLKIVRAWKNRGEIVAMTGDGVNDAPALKHADIGIAMGITGTEVAKEAADMVLSDDNFATIVRAIERGRWIYDNIKKYLTYLLRANITEVVVLGGVVVFMGAEYLPLLPAAILYINLATDGLPALALGVAPPDPDIMRKPPRNPRESVFSKDVRTLILMAVLIECPLFLWMFFQSQPDMELARTRVFFMFVFVELIIAINFRSLRYGLIQAPPHKWLVLAIVWELGLIAVLIQFPAVRDAFGIAMPSASDIGMIVGLGVIVAVAIEVAKFVFRTKERANTMAYR